MLLDLVRAARVVVALELPLVLLMSPLLMFPTPRRLLVLAAVPLVWLCARIATGRIVPNTPLNSALWLMLVMVGVSLWATFDILFSLGKVSGVVLGVLLFWASARWMTNPRRLAVGAAAYVLAGAALAVIGLLGTSWSNKFPMFAPIVAHLPRVIRGIPGAVDGFNANAVAGCVVLFVPLQAGLAFGALRGWLLPGLRARLGRAGLVIALAGMLALTAGTLLLLQSRGAWLGMAVAGFAVCLWFRRWTRWLALSAAAALVVAALVVGTGFLTGGSGSDAADELEVGAATLEIRGLAGRLELWSRAIYGMRDFPFTGMGMNVFRKVMPVLYPAFSISPSADIAHAHNHLLQAALDLGLPGLFSYAAIWLVTTTLLVIVYRRSHEPAMRTVAGGLGAGLVAHFVFSTTDAIPLGAKVGVLFWLTLAVAVALHRVACRADERE